MEQENYLMKKPNHQGYQLLDGNTVHYCNDNEVVFEWALIDLGTGNAYCVAHWVKFEDLGWHRLENIQWAWGTTYDTIEEAEVEYRRQVIKEHQIAIAELQEFLKEEQRLLGEAEKLLPEEEED